jgi:competence protein ComEC
MLGHRPLVKFCIPFIVGIYLGWHFNIEIVYGVGITLAFLIVLLVVRKINSPVFLSTFVLYALIVLFGVAKISFDTRIRSNNSIEYFCNQEVQVVTLMGVLKERAVIKKKSVTFIVQAESVVTDGRASAAEGQVIGTISTKKISEGKVAQLQYGKRVHVQGELQLPHGPRNPGEFDYRKYLQLHDIQAQLIIQKDDNITIGEDIDYLSFERFVFRIREWIGRTLDRLVGGEEAKLLKGLVIGERSEMSPEIKSAFIKTGLMHILAVSGFNVGLVALILFAIFSIVRLPHIITTILTCLGLFFFIFLTGAQPSVVRAGIMAITILLGRLFQEKVDFYNVVAFAVITQLLIDTRTLFDIGFQLSFSAVIALAYFYPILMRPFQHLPERWQENIVVKYSFASLAVSLAASIGTLPISAFYFQRISIVGLVLNLIAVPLSGLLLSLGFTVVVAAMFSTWLSAIYASGASTLSSLLLKLTTVSSALPFAYVETSLSLSGMILCYILLIVVFNIQRKSVQKLLILGVLVVANGLIYMSLFGAVNQSLRVTMLDVGQGDAIFVEFPDGKNMLVDAGPITSSFDAGSRTIVPFLQRQGVKAINKLLVTHPHNDHCGGVPSILRSIHVDEFIGEDYTKSSLAREIHFVLDSLRLTIINDSLVSTIDSYNNSRLYVLFPPEQQLTQNSTNLNNHSVIFKLVYGNTSMLFTGDAEKEAEYRVVHVYRDFLLSDILKAGHHGSKTSSSEGFVNQVKPKIAVVSVGKYNKYHHPSPEVIERLRKMNVQTFRTDEQGAIVLESDGESWKIVDWK